MKNRTIIILLVLITSSFTTSNRVETLIVKEIKKSFDIENFTKESIKITNELNEVLPLKLSETNFFKINNEGSIIGYYYLGSAYGKAAYFDYLVIFNKDLIVSKVKVLTYREDHGGEIKSKRWLKQFNEKSTDKNLKYQEDIVGISGATISVKSMTNDVNKLFKTIGILIKNNQL